MKSIKEMSIKELQSKLKMLKTDKLSAGIGFVLYYDTQIKLDILPRINSWDSRMRTRTAHLTMVLRSLS